VLKGKKPVIRQKSRIRMAEDAEDAAFMSGFVMAGQNSERYGRRTMTTAAAAFKV
jgi:hypothetical protein